LAQLSGTPLALAEPGYLTLGLASAGANQRKWLCDQPLLLITETRPMGTECSSEQLVFEGFAGRQVVGSFDGGEVTSNEEGRFFHGYCRSYCYLPLYIFDGRHLLVAKLRQANIDASAGAKEEIARVLAHRRKA
jgi:hypothetical protein